jgi:hypothetical protein
MRKKVIRTTFVVLLLALMTACHNSSHTQKDDTQVVQTDYSKDTMPDMMALINQPFNMSEMESRFAEMRAESKEHQTEAVNWYFFGEWIYGNWEYSGYDEWVGRYTMYVSISEDNLRWGYNGKESYNGPYEIDFDDEKIYFNRHNGFSTYFKFNSDTERISDGEGHYFKKVNRPVGTSSSNGYSNNSYSSSSQSNVIFRTDSDVIAYTSSHTFKNSMGNRISISFQGMYVNGNLLTNAPRVLRFSGSSATISVSSPYTGGGAMIISVDASRGTITDGSGDVFRIVN